MDLLSSQKLQPKEINHARARNQYFNDNFSCRKLSASVFCHDRKTDQLRYTKVSDDY